MSGEDDAGGFGVHAHNPAIILQWSKATVVAVKD